MVVSLPECDHAIGYAAITDYNMQRLQRKQFSVRQKILATIMALPNDTTSRRLLLLLDSFNQAPRTLSSKKAKKRRDQDMILALWSMQRVRMLSLLNCG